MTLDLAAVLIAKIETRKETRFKDPYIYNPNLEEEGLASPNPAAEENHFKSVIPSQQPLPPFKYVIGPATKDADGGDAGIIPKRTRFYPYVNFIRAKYSTSQQPSTSGEASSRQVREAYLTTGIVVAYMN